MHHETADSQINSSGINTNASNYLSSTMPEFSKSKRNQELIDRLTKFQGFYNKKFNLTSYHKMKESSRSRSKSPERIYLPNKKKGNGIPNDIIPRITFLKTLVHEKRFQRYFKECPKRKENSLEVVSNYICKYKGKHSELDIYLMIFYYICQNIKYDSKGYELDKNNKYDQSPETVYKTGNALSVGFCNLFEYFCKKKNLKYRRIEGFTKLLPPLKDDSKTKYNHFWESIFIKGEWYFIDLVFGSGGFIDLPYELSKSDKDYFNPYYFLIFSEYLILTHIPKDDDWQKTQKILTEKQFMNKRLLNFGQFYKSFYDYDIELLSHDYPFIKINDDNLTIKIKVKDAVIQADLYHSNGKDKLGEVKYTYDDSTKIFSLEPSFPGKGEYVLSVLIRTNYASELLYAPFLEYKIKYSDDNFFRLLNRYKVNLNESFNRRQRPQTETLELPKITGRNYSTLQSKIIPNYNKIFPSKINKKICFDNNNTHIIEPKTTFLRKGIDYKFKIRVKGASNVAVLDGRKFNFLKRIDMEIYEGQYTIHTDNVCICCLRSGNVYTEIFRFRVSEESSYLLKKISKSKKSI